jgi:hypothetical protein
MGMKVTRICHSEQREESAFLPTPAKKQVPRAKNRRSE